MLEGIKGFLRKVGVKLGLIKQLESVASHKKVSLPENFYQKILMWRELHKGYYAEMHDLKYRNIEKGEQTRVMATLGMPKVIANEMATLIFNERCNISISDDGYGKFIEDVFTDNKFNGNFQQYLEFMFAQGGTVVKPYVKNGKVQLSYVTGDCFLPISWSNSNITEGVFVSEIRKQGKVYTHLEWHTFEGQSYVITNELYESATGTDLGTKVSLAVLFPDLEPVVSVSNVSRPLFAYFKPAIANNIDSTVPLGVSIYANSYDTIKALDIAFDSFIREFRLGRKRILVPSHMVKTVIDTDGTAHRYFDATDETYEAFNGDMDDKQIKDISIELRVEEHIGAINAFLNILAMQTGFSSGSFSFDGKSVKTATEVVSENSKTFRTKQSHENVIEQGITDLIECIGVVAQLYGLYTPPAEYDVTVTFDDSIAQDRTADINEQILLVSAGLQSKVKALRKIHGLTEEEARQLLDEIKAESQLGDDDVIDFYKKDKKRTDA
ncbi:phage portal protein [Solibacillus sp. FSL R7-0668]|uniref:phage portal protein n=1 Tax=Solibacillus sp. FSL R7-0668 TaxID=2921688 RepID=UPI0030F72093